MNLFLQFNAKRFETMSKKRKLMWLVIVIVFLFFLLRLFYPETHILHKTEQIEINVVNAFHIQSFSRNSELSTKTYKIESNDMVYYFTFPTFSKDYDMFRDHVENDLLNGRIKMISAVVATEQALEDRIYGRYRILAFDVDGIGYLSIESTKRVLIEHDIGEFLGFLLCGILPLAGMIFEFHLLGIITYRKKPKTD